MAATMTELPNRSWDGLWDSLIYADDIKLKLLDYINATLAFSDANVDCRWTSVQRIYMLSIGHTIVNLVSWNRVVLLHGPPGTVSPEFHAIVTHAKFFVGKDIFMPCACSKTIYPPFSEVYLLHLLWCFALTILGSQICTCPVIRDQFTFTLFEMVLRVRKAGPETILRYCRVSRRRGWICGRAYRYLMHTKPHMVTF